MFAVEIEIAVKALIAETISNSGSTVSAIGNPVPRTGYMVGGAVDSLMFHVHALEDADEVYRQTVRWINQNFAFATKHSTFLGGWVDTEDDTVYFDMSVHVEDLSEAISLARMNDEIAIWDLAKSEEIRIDYATA